MSRLSAIATKLIQSEIVCKWNDPENFMTLSDDEVLQNKLRDFLRVVDMDLGMSDSGNAYYAIHLKHTDNTKAHATQFFKETVNTIKPMLTWMNLFAEALNKDVYVQAGDTIEYAQLIEGIQFDQSLQQQLKTLIPNGGKKDLAESVKALISKLKTEGLIVEIDRYKLRYQFTGKLELMQQALEFIVENEQIYDESASDLQPGLL